MQQEIDINQKKVNIEQHNSKEAPIIPEFSNILFKRLFIIW